MHIEKKTLRNILIGTGGLVILILLLSGSDRMKSVLVFFRDLLFPFLLGAVFAFILNVPVRGYERLLKGIKKNSARRLLAIFMTLLTFVLILTLIFMLLIPQMKVAFQSLTPQLAAFLKKTEPYIQMIKPDWSGWGDLSNFENVEWLSVFKNMFSIFGNSNGAGGASVNDVNMSSFLDNTFSAIGSFAGAVIDFLVALVFAIYCVLQKEKLARQGRKLAYAFLPEKMADGIVRVLRLTNSTFSNFWTGQCLEVCILGCMFAIAMAVFQMPFIPLICVLIAVTAFIPVVGAWMGCVVGAFLIFTSSPVQAFWFIALFAFLQWIENNFIYPRVVGTSVGLPGIWVLAAVVIGGDLMGIAGMILMIPVVSVMYTLLRDMTEKRLRHRGIAPDKLMDQEPDLKPGLNLLSIFQFKKKVKTEKEEENIDQ